MNQDSAGRIPFFYSEPKNRHNKGYIKFGFVVEKNRVIDREFVRQLLGDDVAQHIPENVVIYGLPKGQIKPGESESEAAMRKSAEEIHYNATDHPIYDRHRNVMVPPHEGAVPYLEEIFPITGKRGNYNLTLFVDRIEPGAFFPESLEGIVEDKITERLGHVYKEGRKWGTVADMESSLREFEELASIRPLMENEKMRDLVLGQVKSMRSQLNALKNIESRLVKELRLEGENVACTGQSASMGK